jgi:hypothetical protein
MDALAQEPGGGQMVVDDETYTFIKASDVVRDGVALECWRRYEHEDRALVAEAFWHDDTGKFTIQMPEGDSVCLSRGVPSRSGQVVSTFFTQRRGHPKIDLRATSRRRSRCLAVVTEVVGDQTFGLSARTYRLTMNTGRSPLAMLSRAKSTGLRMGRWALWP